MNNFMQIPVILCEYYYTDDGDSSQNFMEEEDELALLSPIPGPSSVTDAIPQRPKALMPDHVEEKNQTNQAHR